MRPGLRLPVKARDASWLNNLLGKWKGGLVCVTSNTLLFSVSLTLSDFLSFLLSTPIYVGFHLIRFFSLCHLLFSFFHSPSLQWTDPFYLRVSFFCPHSLHYSIQRLSLSFWLLKFSPEITKQHFICKCHIPSSLSLNLAFFSFPSMEVWSAAAPLPSERSGAKWGHKPQLTNMSSMKKNCISVKCGSVGLLGNGYAEIEANLFGFSQKGLNGIRDITSWRKWLLSWASSLQRLKISDQKIK